MDRRRIGSVAVLVTVCAQLAMASPSSAGEEILGAASYPDMSTYKCKTDPLPISPGQNLNLVAATTTCPHAKKISGPGSASTFDPGSGAQGYVTRFQPSMQEIKNSGKLVTPSVWDLHLHHVVWLRGGSAPTFASGEEKTTVKMPQGYGHKVGAGALWGLNYMIHSLNASSGREVQITWKIDWVPETSPARTDIKPTTVRWLDPAGSPQIYPVFDAEKGFDTDADGEFVFPDDADEPSEPAYEEESPKISSAGTWTVPAGGVTLVFGAGHLHPGGTSVDLQVERGGEVKQLFRSDAHYYEPAGAVSWDVSMEATRPDWRVSLKAGDVVTVNSTYDVSEASWYESMGILPLAYSTASDPLAKDPFDDAAAVQAMYDAGGILTHGRLPENIDTNARKNLHLPDPRDLASKGEVPASGIDIDGFVYQLGGYSATKATPAKRMRPPTISPGESVFFTNLDALSSMSQDQQAWHSITSCKAPCNKGSGIGYPLADGPIKFDSGQLGYGTEFSSEVTTGSNEFTTPPLTDPGTYTYFCRIHPFMRGSVRVE